METINGEILSLTINTLITDFDIHQLLKDINAFG